MRRLVFWTMVCLMITVQAITASASDSIALRYKFAKGQFYRYRFSNKCQFSGEGIPSRAIELSGVLRIRVIKVLPDGGAQIRVAVESCEASGGTIPMTVNANKILPVLVTVSPDGTVKDRCSILKGRNTKLVAGDSSFYATEDDLFEPGFCMLSAPLPDGKVKAGDTWKKSVEGVDSQEPLVADCRLVDVSTQQGKTTATITSLWNRSTSKVDSDSVPHPGKSVCEDKYSFDVERGWPVGLVEKVTDSHDFDASNAEGGPKHLTVKVEIQATLLPNAGK